MLVVFSLLGKAQGVSLTLAGVAGIIVSIGITSDSYIVYYERIKEEVRAGRSMRVAIDHAFRRAFRTMVTADTVSLAASILLFILAVGSVKGFALALGVATVTDLVVAYFFTRPAVALAGYTRWGEGRTVQHPGRGRRGERLRRAGQGGGEVSLAHRLYHGETHFDFVGKRRWWFGVSAVLVLASALSLGLARPEHELWTSSGGRWWSATTRRGPRCPMCAPPSTGSGRPGPWCR